AGGCADICFCFARTSPVNTANFGSAEAGGRATGPPSAPGANRCTAGNNTASAPADPAEDSETEPEVEPKAEPTCWVDWAAAVLPPAAVLRADLTGRVDAALRWAINPDTARLPAAACNRCATAGVSVRDGAPGTTGAETLTSGSAAAREPSVTWSGTDVVARRTGLLPAPSSSVVVLTSRPQPRTRYDHSAP
ncbi:hypothetical protein, partial [Micromonospora polyrhachis]